MKALGNMKNGHYGCRFRDFLDEESQLVTFGEL